MPTFPCLRIAAVLRHKYSFGRRGPTRAARPHSIGQRSFTEWLLLGCPSLLVLIFGIFLTAPGAAQQTPRSWGTQDKEVPKLSITANAFGKHDATATSVLVAYMKAVGLVKWQGLTASGTMNTTGSTEQETLSLQVLPRNRARMDSVRGAKTSSSILNGMHGRLLPAERQSTPLAPTTAATGLLPFTLPFDVLANPTGYAVTDRGSSTIDGEQLRRITVEIDTSKAAHLRGSTTRAVVDLYFDPQTDLLEKSVALITLPAAPLQQMTRIDTYSGYSQQTGFTFPHTISETLDGQPMWSMNLTLIDPTTLPSPERF